MKKYGMGTCFGLIVLIVFVTVFSSILEGWVLSMLWKWFFVPLFGLPNLTIAYAIGIAIVIGLLTHQEITNNSSSDDEISDVVIKVLTRAFVSPLIILAFGYVVHLFI